MLRSFALLLAALILGAGVAPAASSAAAKRTVCGTTTTLNDATLEVTVPRGTSCSGAVGVVKSFTRRPCEAADPSCLVNVRGHRCTLRLRYDLELPFRFGACRRSGRTVSIWVVGWPTVDPQQCGQVNGLDISRNGGGTCEAGAELMRQYLDFVGAQGRDCRTAADRCRTTISGYACGTFRESDAAVPHVGLAVHECVARGKAIVAATPAA